MWLTPFTPGKDHVIHITLHDITTIAMIRIWVGVALILCFDWLYYCRRTITSLGSIHVAELVMWRLPLMTKLCLMVN